ncbi:hypothetical protein VTN77DRAFT_4037 [Rasamsonia byssochlamydoides]|uniref:uncharacterized protein n=1 Tax=Rasamsonia byssochlamydoides TaxID=89139 RepID=UPI003744659B
MMIAMLNSKVSKVAVAVLCIFFLLRAIIGQRYATSDLLARFHGRHHHVADDRTLANIRNETLGFEKIFAIGLKERTDRHDYLTLSASISGFQVEWMDGVKGETIPEKALPEGFNMTILKPAQAGCWRAHMNALVKIVEDRISTALIMEDDADWDVSIKSQLTEFARGARALQRTEHANPQTPYGADWDLLWIGGCASGPGPDEKEFYVIPNDPTVPPVHHRATWGGPREAWKTKYPNLPEDSTRFVYRAAMGCCLYGYAVTYDAARKILASLALDYLDEPVDNALSRMCEGSRGRPKLRCIAPFPNIIGMYRAAGSAQRDSDIDYGAPEVRHGAEAWNLVYSVRMNIHRLVEGAQTVLSQWKDENNAWSSREVRLEEFEYPGGYLIDIDNTLHGSLKPSLHVSPPVYRVASRPVPSRPVPPGRVRTGVIHSLTKRPFGAVLAVLLLLFLILQFTADYNRPSSLENVADASAGVKRIGKRIAKVSMLYGLPNILYERALQENADDIELLRQRLDELNAVEMEKLMQSEV